MTSNPNEPPTPAARLTPEREPNCSDCAKRPVCSRFESLSEAVYRHFDYDQEEEVEQAIAYAVAPICRYSEMLPNPIHSDNYDPFKEE
jgi:hypothetical protein